MNQCLATADPLLCSQIVRTPTGTVSGVTAAGGGYWAVTRHAQARVGVSNVFDKDPPFVPLEASGAAGGLNIFPHFRHLGPEHFMALHATS